MSDPRERGFAQFWQSLAGIGFSLWAVLVPISAKWVVDSLQQMSAAQSEYAKAAAVRNEQMEGRIVRIEERQQFIMKQIIDLQTHVANERNHK